MEATSMVTEHQRSQRGDEWQNIFEVCESEAAFMGRVRIWDSSQAAAYHQAWTFFASIFAVSVIKDKIRSLVGCRAVRYRTFNIRSSIK